MNTTEYTEGHTISLRLAPLEARHLEKVPLETKEQGLFIVQGNAVKVALRQLNFRSRRV